MRTPVAPIAITRVENGTSVSAEDLLVTEEPLEIRLGYGPEHDRTEIRLSVTMRTPGNDEELTRGFLFTEGLITDPAQLLRVAYCENVKEEERGNVVRAELHPSVDVDPAKWQRNFYTTSSCGVCGKSSIEAVQVNCPTPLPKAPRGTLSAPNAKLPLPLQRFRPAGEEMGRAHQALRIQFPLNGSRLDLGSGDGSASLSTIALKVSGGVLPLTIMLNGRMVTTLNDARQAQIAPEGPGFTRLTVMDASGAADTIVVRLQ